MMSIQHLKQLLLTGQTTSLSLTMNAIALANLYQEKNALATISPRALSIAQERDDEIKQGKIRGPLHGIPIVIKDNIFYNDGTPTTCNSYALKDFYPLHNASIIDALIHAGAVILGKANLSEFAYFMGDEKMPSGYGSMYGQVRHPFDESIDPYGSSTGSAVAVSLGIVPAAIGSETNGSLMAPAYQCQIVSFKPSFGMVSRYGMIPVSSQQDIAGPMATNVYDCALLMDVLSFVDAHDPTTFDIPRPLDWTEAVEKPPRHARVAVVSFVDQPYDQYDKVVLEKTQARLKKLGHTVVNITIPLPPLENHPTLLVEFKHAMNSFLSQYHTQGTPPSLSDLITFNQSNELRCLRYGQATLEASNHTQGDLLDAKYLGLRRQLLKESETLEQLMNIHNLQAVVTPTWLGFAPIFGNPSVCLPEGVFAHQPKATVWVGRRYDDRALLALTNQYQKR